MADIFERTAAHLHSLMRGKRFLCTEVVLMGAVPTANRVIAAGGQAMAMGAQRGAGTIPEGVLTLDLALPPNKDKMVGMRQGMAALRDPPPWAMEIIETFDPDESAQVLPAFFDDAQEQASRRVYGARDPRWVALEDKTRCDEVWDQAGVGRAPIRILEPHPEECWSAHLALDQGAGTMWAADNKTGWHGGASLLRWVRTKSEAESALRDLGPASNQIRIMPFLTGIPCSIHGIVFPDHILTLRPVEMIVLHKPGDQRLFYARVGTYWLPEPEIIESMRALAIRVGTWLKGEVDYRGAFTVDGV